MMSAPVYQSHPRQRSAQRALAAIGLYSVESYQHVPIKMNYYRLNTIDIALFPSTHQSGHLCEV
jgi:hypothetical protein